MGLYSHVKLPFPRLHRFAIIQMDPVAMIEQLNIHDDEALSEAHALTTKKYLVYIAYVGCLS